MVRVALIFLLLFVTPISHGSDSHLQLVANKNEVELGKPITVTITAYNIDREITNINTDVVLTDFGVYVLESESKSSDKQNKIQELKINLYPQRIGKLNIPSISLGERSTTPIAITALPASEDNGALDFNTTLSSSSVWQRQQVMMTTSLITHSKFSKIELDEFTHNGIESYELKMERTELNDGRYKLTAGWVLYPLIEGTYNIHYPAVNYYSKGKIQRRFISPSTQLTVKALPPYIPPLMPVGKITVNKRIGVSDEETNNSHVLSVDISSTQALPSTLPNLPRNYIDNQNIITEQTSSTLNTTLNDNRFISRIQHYIPISFSTSNLYHFPALSYKYFDPNTGKIITVKDKPDSILILSLWIKILLILVLCFVLIKNLILITKYVSNSLKLRKKRKLITASTLNAQSPQELHCLLNQYVDTYHWGGNMTLSHLCEIWKRHLNTSPDDALNSLSCACYTKEWDVNALPTLRSKIYQLLKRY